MFFFQFCLESAWSSILVANECWSRDFLMWGAL